MDLTNYLDTYQMTARESDPDHHPGHSEDHRHHRRRGHGHQPVPGQGRHGHRGQARPAGRGRRADRQAERDDLPAAPVGPPAPHGLLAGGQGLRQASWRPTACYTMGDIARCSIGKPTDYYNEDLLYKLFGVNAEILIDHAWGWEPCTIADVESVQAGEQEHRLRPGAPVPLRLPEGPAGGAGDGGRPGPGPGGQGAGDQPAGAHRGL